MSLETLPIPSGGWRDGVGTSRVYECFVDKSGFSPCRGSSRRSQSGEEQDGAYCISGHRGPLCQICTNKANYYDRTTGRCLECSPSYRFARFFGILFGSVAVLGLLFFASKKVKALRRVCGRIHAIATATNVSFRAKVKVLISFFQVFNTLGNVYGVRLHPDFAGWWNFLSAFNLPVMDFMLPGTCVGSMQARLALNSLWPIVVLIFVAIVIPALVAAKRWLDRKRSNSSELSTLSVSRDHTLNAVIFIIFLVLPNVTQSIFEARKCVSFSVSDDGSSNSYLLADLDVRCNGPEFRQLNTHFVAFLTIWLLVPFIGLALLLAVQSSVRARRPSNLANACRFLWRDYDTSFMYWEIFDMLRKMLLTALILFVDTEFGEIRLLRLWMGAFVSGGYLALLALARPFKLNEDLYLACTSNLLLTACFLSGIAIKLCEDQAWEHSCKEYLGINDSYQANVFVLIITIVMLILSFGVIVIKAVMTVRTGTICLTSTGREPNMELPANCSFHCFLSHAWRTGQDQTHTIARQLQLFLPEIRVWLDVDNLHDVGKLEESVIDSAVFIIFLSSGYFRSANCRRELYTALAKGKPIITVREEDRDKGGATVEELKQECMECCTEQEPAAYPEFQGPSEVIERVLLAEESIVWVRVRDFQIESLKLIAFRMVKHLPYYIENTQELEKGLKVAGELVPCGFNSSVRVLICDRNHGAHQLAEELVREGAGAMPISIQSVSNQADLMRAQQAQFRLVLLLYLNKYSFVDSQESVGEVVKHAMDMKISIIPVHEQDAEKGGCGFGAIFDQTPEELVLEPYKLWDTLAIPLYRAKEHRRISLRHMLYGMGAMPLRGARARQFANNALHSHVGRCAAESSENDTVWLEAHGPNEETLYLRQPQAKLTKAPAVADEQDEAGMPASLEADVVFHMPLQPRSESPRSGHTEPVPPSCLSLNEPGPKTRRGSRVPIAFQVQTIGRQDFPRNLVHQPPELEGQSRRRSLPSDMAGSYVEELQLSQILQRDSSSARRGSVFLDSHPDELEWEGFAHPSVTATGSASRR